MRRVIAKNTQIEELIKEINNNTTRTFYLNGIKLVVSVLRLCEICKKWYKNSDMEKLDDINCCFWCKESAFKHSD